MENRQKMEHVITDVLAGSIAEEVGIEPGDILVAIDGADVADIVDYEYFCARELLTLTVRKPDGQILEAEIEKDEEEWLGIGFENGLMSRTRLCANHCVFCFVDQMPPGMRPTLYVKDDDWRMSFMMGNFVTLTNVSDQELQRIIDRHIPVLYVSVHATDPELRVRMMRQPRAARLMEQLKKLIAGGVALNCQIVLCPGWNDGEALERTLTDLWSLGPGVRSVAAVPVGLTGHREGLEKLQTYNAESAGRLLEQVERWQARCLAERGTRFIFPADEFYAMCGREVPEAEAYEGYPQIENGIGMMRKFEDELRAALRERKPGCAKGRKVTMATGVSATPWLGRMAALVAEWTGLAFQIITVKNHFFGGTVTVAGLLVGQDLAEALKGRIEGDRLVLPRSMLRENEDTFLDDSHLDDLSKALGCRIKAAWVDGADFLSAVLDD